MMRALLLCLLSALIGPLGRAAVQPADCDSSAQDLVPLDRENLNVNKVIEGTAVSVDGVLNAFHTSHHFVLQSMDGSLEMTVVTPRPVAVSAAQGDWVRVTGTVIASGSQTTLLLRDDSDAVKVCGMPSHSRRLKFWLDAVGAYKPPPEEEEEECSCH